MARSQRMPNKNIDYLIEISDSEFELKFNIQDFFYNQSVAYVSISDFVFLPRPDQDVDYRVISIYCMDKSHPIYRDGKIVNAYASLGLVDVQLQSGQQRLVRVNTQPVRVNIEDRRIRFQLGEVLTGRDFDFSNILRAFVRIVVQEVYAP